MVSFYVQQRPCVRTRNWTFQNISKFVARKVATSVFRETMKLETLQNIYIYIFFIWDFCVHMCRCFVRYTRLLDSGPMPILFKCSWIKWLWAWSWWRLSDIFFYKQNSLCIFCRIQVKPTAASDAVRTVKRVCFEYRLVVVEFDPRVIRGVDLMKIKWRFWRCGVMYTRLSLAGERDHQFQLTEVYRSKCQVWGHTLFCPLRQLQIPYKLGVNKHHHISVSTTTTTSSSSWIFFAQHDEDAADDIVV